MMRMKWHKGGDKKWGKREMEPDSQKATRTDRRRKKMI